MFVRKFSTSCSCREQVKTGVLMLNMGGPSKTSEVQDFLTRLFTDKDIIKLPFQSVLGPLIAKRRTPSIIQKYEEIGGGSPIRDWTEKQGKLVCELLDKKSPATAPHKAYTGFRYAAPLMEDTLEEIHKDAPEHVVAFSKYPQYSCATSGSSYNAIAKYYKKQVPPFKLSVVERWSLLPALIETHVQNIKAELSKLPLHEQEQIVLLFSAHSLPLYCLKRGDPYFTEMAATVEAIMKNFDLPYRLVWQSKVGPIEWMSPSTDFAMKQLAARGRRHIMLIPVAFVNEHIETLHELDIEYGKELADEINVKVSRVPTPNTHPVFIEGVADMLAEHLHKKIPYSKQFMLNCPGCDNPGCYNMRAWFRYTCSL